MEIKSDNRLLKIYLSKKDLLDEILSEHTVEGTIHSTNTNLDGKIIELVFDAEKSSQFLSFLNEDPRYKVIMGPRNFVDLLKGKEVVGVYKDKENDFGLRVSYK